MPESLGSRLRSAWNAFTGAETRAANYGGYGPASSIRPDRVRFTRGNEKSIVTSMFTRIAIDCAAIKIHHARLDEEDRFKEVVKSGLNRCLNLEANIDQTGRALKQDIVMSMFDEGAVAVVPVDTTRSIWGGAFDVESLRVGKILEWYPDKIKVRLYNERKGMKEDIIVPKRSSAIIENPLYAIVNEQNSTVQRLIRKLNLLDMIDEQSGSGKLDLIIQLPYVIKTEARKQQAEQRRKDIEMQLAGSKYGIAYTDGTEKITQLNRSVENNLLNQIDMLTKQVYAQLGLTEEVMNGTADEKTMLNYYNRTIEPIVSAIVDEFNRKFISKTALAQKQAVVFFNDQFRLVPLGQMADIADKFTRNEILSSNEVRQIIGRKPIDAPQADELRNKNLNPAEGQQYAMTDDSQYVDLPSEDYQNGSEVNGY